jgi:gliding motility-associated-like protein
MSVNAFETSGVSCFGQSDGTITVLTSGGVGLVEYSIDNGATFQPSNVFSNLATGSYKLTVRDQTTCEPTYEVSRDVIVSTPDPLALTDIKSEGALSEFDATGSISITVAGGTQPYTIEWSNGAEGDIIQNLLPGTYVATVVDDNGCSLSQSVEVENFFAGLNVSNALSPNGDGMNDTWVINGLEKFEENEVTVFNKRGQILYRRKNYDNSWTGETNESSSISNYGGKVPQGTYFYTVRISKFEFTGFVDVRY